MSFVVFELKTCFLYRQLDRVQRVSAIGILVICVK